MDSALYYFGLGCVILVLVALAGRAIVDRSAIFKFPTLAALLGIAWVVPQAFALEGLRVNEYATEGFWLYVAVCFAFIAIGFRIGKWFYDRREMRDRNHRKVDYDRNRLLVACFGLALLGWLSLFLLRGMNPETLGAQWTGQAAFLALLGKASGLALCMSVLVYARTRSKFALVLAILVALPILQTVLVGVRRELLFDLVLLSGGVWLFATKRYPPRAALIAVVVIGTIVLNSAGDLRAFVKSGEGTLVEALTSADTYTSFDYLERDVRSANEIRQAQFDHWRTNQYGVYEYGASYWNGMIQLYVPAFILGRDFKESLRIEPNSSRAYGMDATQISFHGSTRTGFADSYVNFGVFGILVFLLIGVFFGYLHANAIVGGLAGQFLYFAMLAEGLKAITHATSAFVSALPFTLLLVWGALQLAKAGKRAVKARQYSQPMSSASLPRLES